MIKRGKFIDECGKIAFVEDVNGFWEVSDDITDERLDWQPVTPESYDGKSNLTKVSTEEIEKNRCKAYKRIL